MGRSQELSEFQRGAVIGCHLRNKSSREICGLLNIPQSTVCCTITKWKRLGTTATQPRSGRPRKITERGQQMLRRIVRGGRQLSAESIATHLQTSCDLQISSKTVRRELHGMGLLGRAAASKPDITSASIAQAVIGQQRRKKQQLLYPAPAPDTDPNPGPAPDPDPTPDTDPTPGPAPDPDPTPDTDPAPGPDSTPDPDPTPDTDPAPGPDSTPDPDPTPDTDPAPGPNSTPVTGPGPVPALDPDVDPAPDPNLDPAPGPAPDPSSSPSPIVLKIPLERVRLPLASGGSGGGSGRPGEDFKVRIRVPERRPGASEEGKSRDKHRDRSNHHHHHSSSSGGSSSSHKHSASSGGGGAAGKKPSSDSRTGSSSSSSSSRKRPHPEPSPAAHPSKPSKSSRNSYQLTALPGPPAHALGLGHDPYPPHSKLDKADTNGHNVGGAGQSNEYQDTFEMLNSLLSDLTVQPSQGSMFNNRATYGENPRYPGGSRGGAARPPPLPTEPPPPPPPLPK